MARKKLQSFNSKILSDGGVERTLGNVKQVALPPGVYQTITKTVDEFTAKEIAIPIDNMRPKSSDNLTMQDVDIDVY